MQLRQQTLDPTLHCTERHWAPSCWASTFNLCKESDLFSAGLRLQLQTSNAQNLAMTGNSYNKDLSKIRLIQHRTKIRVAHTPSLSIADAFLWKARRGLCGCPPVHPWVHLYTPQCFSCLLVNFVCVWCVCMRVLIASYLLFILMHLQALSQGLLFV